MIEASIKLRSQLRLAKAGLS